MIRRASCSFVLPLLLTLFLTAINRVRAAPADELPADGQNAMNAEHEKWAQVWTQLITGAETADPANTQHQQAVDAFARWTTYRLTWDGLTRVGGGVCKLLSDLDGDLGNIRVNKEKTQKLAEMYTNRLIAHALEVTDTRKPVARINAAYILFRLANRSDDETAQDVLNRLAWTNQTDLANAIAATIKDPNQIDAARLWAFKGLQKLLALPATDPPSLPREKAEAALGEVLKFLQARNKPFPPGATEEEIDGFRYVRREAIKALAQNPYPTLATLPDKPHPVLVLLQFAANVGVQPTARLDERFEAAVGVARAQPALDPDYQPGYAAHPLGFFLVDFIGDYGKEKQRQAGNPDLPSSQPWKVDASRLIEALELMKEQAKNDAQVALVADQATPLLQKIEKALDAPNESILKAALDAAPSPEMSLFKSDPQSVVKPEEKKDK